MIKNEKPCRIAILGTAGIARKLWKAIHLASNAELVAVASRETKRAERFISQCQAEVPTGGQVESDEQPSRFVRAVGSYEEAIASDDIDAVYVPLPTGLRSEWLFAAAKAGKSILSEKPVARHADELSELIEVCRTNSLAFLDGVMFDHSPRHHEVLQQIRIGRLGTLRRIQTHFSFPGGDDFESTNIRANGTLEPHGALGDLGWYGIRFALNVADRLPRSVRARSLQTMRSPESDHEVPSEMTCDLEFGDGLSANIYCGFDTCDQQTAMVSGTEGYLRLDDFVLPFYDGFTKAYWNHSRLDIDNCRWNYRSHVACESFDELPGGEFGSQEVRMVEHFASLAKSGCFDEDDAIRSLHTQMVVDAIRRSDANDGDDVVVETR